MALHPSYLGVIQRLDGELIYPFRTKRAGKRNSISTIEDAKDLAKTLSERHKSTNAHKSEFVIYRHTGSGIPDFERGPYSVYENGKIAPLTGGRVHPDIPRPRPEPRPVPRDVAIRRDRWTRMESMLGKELAKVPDVDVTSLVDRYDAGVDPTKLTDELFDAAPQGVDEPRVARLIKAVSTARRRFRSAAQPTMFDVGAPVEMTPYQRKQAWEAAARATGVLERPSAPILGYEKAPARIDEAHIERASIKTPVSSLLEKPKTKEYYAEFYAKYLPQDEGSAAEWSRAMSELRAEKPRPIGKLFGKSGPPTPERAAAHQAEESAWSSAYRRASAMQKKRLTEENAAFRAVHTLTTRDIQGLKHIAGAGFDLDGERTRKLEAAGLIVPQAGTSILDGRFWLTDKGKTALHNAEPEARAAFEAKRDARLERLRGYAAKKASEAEGALTTARAMADRIPFGQPILVGHHSEKRDRNYREKIDSKFRKGFEASSEAQAAERRLAHAERNTVISSDDPDAVAKLKLDLEQIQKNRALMVEANKIIRKLGTGEDTIRALIAMGFTETTARTVVQKDFAGRIGFPDYKLTNTGAEARRIQKRIDELTARAAKAPTGPVTYGTGDDWMRIEESDNRTRLFFPGKPDDKFRAFLKSRGFKWAPSIGAWQRMTSNASNYHAKEVAERFELERRKRAGETGPLESVRKELEAELAAVQARIDEAYHRFSRSSSPKVGPVPKALFDQKNEILIKLGRKAEPVPMASGDTGTKDTMSLTHWKSKVMDAAKVDHDALESIQHKVFDWYASGYTIGTAVPMVQAALAQHATEQRAATERSAFKRVVADAASRADAHTNANGWDVPVPPIANTNGPLDSIRTLYRQADTMALYGIPYAMRPGQSPRDLEKAGNTKGWMWLGSPGWWGSLSKERQDAIRAFLDTHKDYVPQGPYEWSLLPSEVQNDGSIFGPERDRALAQFMMRMAGGFVHGATMIELLAKEAHGKFFTDSSDADKLLKHARVNEWIKDAGFKPNDPTMRAQRAAGMGGGKISAAYLSAHGWEPGPKEREGQDWARRILGGTPKAPTAAERVAPVVEPVKATPEVVMPQLAVTAGFHGLNPKEAQLLTTLRKFGTATIAQLATAFPDAKDAAQANSWVRNSLRRLVEYKLTVQAARGTYTVVA